MNLNKEHEKHHTARPPQGDRDVPTPAKTWLSPRGMRGPPKGHGGHGAVGTCGAQCAHPRGATSVVPPCEHTRTSEEGDGDSVPPLLGGDRDAPTVLQCKFTETQGTSGLGRGDPRVCRGGGPCGHRANAKGKCLPPAPRSWGALCTGRAVQAVQSGESQLPGTGDAGGARGPAPGWGRCCGFRGGAGGGLCRGAQGGGAAPPRPVGASPRRRR